MDVNDPSEPVLCESYGINDSNNFVQQISLLLKSENYEEIIRLINSNKFMSCMEEQSSEVLTTLAENLSEVVYNDNRELFHHCEDILYKIAAIAKPDIVLIDFIEHAEKNDDILFMTMLKAMKISLSKKSDNLGQQIMWCCNTVIRHISYMEHSEDFKLDGEEYILFENTDSSRKLIDVYNCVLNFCEPFSNERFNIITSDQATLEDARDSFLSFLVKLLGRPLVNMNLEEKKNKGEFRLIAEKVLHEIMKFQIDLMYFLNFVSKYQSKKKEKLTDVTDLDYNNISLAVFYYLIFKEQLYIQNISHVYNPLYVFEMLTILSVELLSTMHSGVQQKGLQLFQAALQRIVDYSLKFICVQDNLYGELSESLCNIMIYSEVKTNRQSAVHLFKSFLLKFNSEGRFIIILNIQSKIKSPNFVGYIIPITKDLVLKALDEKNPADLEYFTGQNLRNLLKKFCHLHNGPESDLIELSDQIVSALNMLRFLFIRDKENISGIADFIPYLEKEFFEPLKKGLSLSVAHYKLQINALNNKAPGEKVTVSVGGTQLPPVSKERQIEILNTALSTFDLLESLRARTQECLDEFQQLQIN
ncbi:glomulin [Halyomorpha halys]|uniref:glomulin n=1 Tax=Halyomorpha halys TaxID=286706 RepID=UPI0006D50C99|nr:glomulin [Halyomorpha halys]